MLDFRNAVGARKTLVTISQQLGLGVQIFGYMANSRNPIRFGLIGCGRVTETRHLPALQPLEGAEVVALSDISPTRLKEVADVFHIKGRHIDYQQLLSDPSIDAVAVCVPAQFHVEVALAALDAGKHVFWENSKPFGLF